MHNQSGFREFLSPPEDSLCPFVVNPCSHPQLHLRKYNYAWDLPFMDISRQWNLANVVLHLTSSIQHNVLEVHRCYNKFLDFVPFLCVYQLILIWIASSLSLFNSWILVLFISCAVLFGFAHEDYSGLSNISW